MLIVFAMDKDFNKSYDQLMKDYKPSQYINQDWPMKDGMYQQYSAFEDDVQCASGTHTSIVML